jgi:hypothetical protein
VADTGGGTQLVTVVDPSTASLAGTFTAWARGAGGNLIWISAARRGADSEIITARHDHLPDRLRAAGPGALAGLGFTGLDPDPDDPVIITGYKSTRTSKTTPAQRHANQALSAARAPVEHGFSDLKNRRILTRLRLSPANATRLLRALLVLTRQHTSR